MKYGIHTLDDFEWRGKVVLCRLDINAPLDRETGGLRDVMRLKGCAPTVRELAETGARVVLLAHQGGDLESPFPLPPGRAENQQRGPLGHVPISQNPPSSLIPA